MAAENRVNVSANKAGWQPYARYFVEGDALMLTFAGGSREVWHRG